MFTKTKQFLTNPSKKDKIAMAVGSAMTAAMPFATMALADGAMTGASSDAASQLISTVLGVICDIFLAIGVLLLAWSIGMLFLAFKNEDADSKSRSMMMAVVSIVLVAFKGILTVILDATGTSVKIGKGIF